jgi:putative protease
MHIFISFTELNYFYSVINSTDIQIELLAPARNADFGKAAINHGADAVYIGAPQFSARNAASNTIKEIEQLIGYAHLFKVKVYAALNTILYDNEIEEAGTIITTLYQSGIDGIILQDLGLLELNLPPVPLIASTQTHNTTIEKVLFFEKLGFKRVILARELSLMQIQEIRNKTNIELESFVHGAICVSYSGQCYISEAICKRSGNRGMCAQPCRSVYDLSDENNKVLIKNKHLLSQKDLNLSAYLSELINAGITSFKIEGRLKDVSYVKNITSFYRQRLDAMIENNANYSKTSSGTIHHYFEPDPERSFNRGFTSYFINGRKEKTGQPDTQKSIGKRIGYVTSKGPNWITTDCDELVNGDGICFFGSDSVLNGTLVNKVSGNKVFFNSSIEVEVGTEIYRNHDQQFEKMLSGKCAERKISVSLSFSESPDGYILQAVDCDGTEALIETKCDKLPAKNTELAKNTIVTQLSRLGESVFESNKIEVKTGEAYFLPASLINEMRRRVINELEKERINNYKPEQIVRPEHKPEFYKKEVLFTENVSNLHAQKFYHSLGILEIEPAFELLSDRLNKVVMTTRYCIRYQFDACPVYQKNKVQWNNPLFLRDQNHTYKLDFDCKKCEMQLIFIQ